MPRKKQEQKSQEMRSLIIEIAQRIIVEEGAGAVSIRRVAVEMGYSPTIIYHYFRDKEQLLSYAVREGYRRILAAVAPVAPGLPADEDLRVSFKNFVNCAMLVPNAYKAFILNFSPEFLTGSAILGEDGHENSPTFTQIISCIEAGIATGLFSPCDVRLTAKAFWSAGFGLFFRLLFEPDIPQDQRDAVMERLLDILLKGISV